MPSPNRISEPPRPRPLHVSKSFSRIESSSPTSPSARSRSKTFQIGSTPSANDLKRTKVKVVRGLSDVFESGLAAYGSEDEDMPNPSGKLPPDFDELPIELVSIADRSVAYFYFDFLISTKCLNWLINKFLASWTRYQQRYTLFPLR